MEACTVSERLIRLPPLHRSGLLAAAALVLAACENDAASYQIGGSKDHALTLIREQRYFWDRDSTVALVVARYPDCQRRHALNQTPAGEPAAELFQTGAQSFLLRNGTSWYAIDTQGCTLQPAGAPAAGAAGDALGKFDRQGDKLRFIPAPVAAR